MSNINDIIAQIKGEVNLLDLLQRHGLDPKKTGRQYQCLCPFHEEKTPSFTVNISKGYINCFGCPWAGDAVKFVKDFTKVDTITACKELISMYGLNIQLDENKPNSHKDKSAKEPVKPKSNLKKDYPLLQHLKLASFPEDYEIVSPTPNKSKALSKEDKANGVAYRLITPYIYNLDPYAYKLKIELFDNEDNRIKKFCEWWHKNYLGDHIKTKGDYHGNCYRITEAIELGKGKIIAICEGEKDTETLRKLGIVAISFDSSDFTQLSEIDCDGFVIFGDNDETGKTKLEKVAKACHKLDKPCLVVPITTLWIDAPEKSDITDYIEAFGISRDELVQKLSAIAFPNGANSASDRTTSKTSAIEAVDESQKETFDPEMILPNGTTVDLNHFLDLFGEKYPVFFENNLEGLSLCGFEEVIEVFRIEEKCGDNATAMPTKGVIQKWFRQIWKFLRGIDVDKFLATKLHKPEEITPELPEIPKIKEITPELPEKPENVRGIIFHPDFHTKLGNPKIVTRRKWSDKTGEKYVKYFEDGVLIPALSASQGNGQIIGYLKLTERPQRQPLLEMTQQDLIDEGCEHLTREQFIRDWFDNNPALSPWVFKFQFFPNATKKQIDDFKDNYEQPIITDKTHYTHRALQALYIESKKRYISIKNSITGKIEIYCDGGTHYQVSEDEYEKYRISDWLIENMPELLGKTYVEQILDWAKIRLIVKQDRVNPPGLNIKNGVLKVFWANNGEAVVRLMDHDPDVIYTYCSEVNYNPEADPEYANQLLRCLEPGEREIFLRTIACAFDLPFLRTKLPKRVRALILQGEGNNGKDALQLAVQQLFGFAMTNATINDFIDYDHQRKFPLAKLDNALVSWSSENVPFVDLDKVQCLKAAITGNSLAKENKGKDEGRLEPKCVFVFNCNDLPSIKSGSEAMESRWAILRFRKIFKDNPNKKKGELKGDPRFAYDHNWVANNVAPALLNFLIEELKTLAVTGINYQPVTENVEELKREACHLHQICYDLGIVENPDGKIYLSDLWEMIRQWYIGDGTLEIIPSEGKGKDKEIWHDRARRNDRNIKAPNQVATRFSDVFPKIKIQRETKNREKLGCVFLSGIEKRGVIASLASHSRPEPITASLTASHSEAMCEATALVPQMCEASEAITPLFSAFVEKIKKQTFAEKIKLLENIFTPDEWGMLLRGTKTYEKAPSALSPGSVVIYEGEQRKVIASTHSHVQLEGEKYAVHLMDVELVAS